MVEGGHALSGQVHINGAKNSAVALIPAAILSDYPVTVDNLPLISDVEILKDLLQHIGADVKNSCDLTDKLGSAMANVIEAANKRGHVRGSGSRCQQSLGA